MDDWSIKDHTSGNRSESCRNDQSITPYLSNINLLTIAVFSVSTKNFHFYKCWITAASDFYFTSNVFFKRIMNHLKFWKRLQTILDLIGSDFLYEFLQYPFDITFCEIVQRWFSLWWEGQNWWGSFTFISVESVHECMIGSNSENKIDFRKIVTIRQCIWELFLIIRVKYQFLFA